jgi:hypothetical protein
MANEYAVLDGIAPSWADISVKASPYGANLVEMADIAAINSGCTVEVGVQRSPAGRVNKTTTGSVDNDASMTLYQSAYQTFLRQLMAIAPTRNGQLVISLVHFDIQLQFTPPGSVDIFERHIRGCRVLTNTLGATEGTDANKIEIALHCKQVVDIIDGREVVLL